MIEIRDERDKDVQAIRQVVVAAGGGNPKDKAADLVELLRERNKALISLVAVSNETVVGHIMFSPLNDWIVAWEITTQTNINEGNADDRRFNPER